MLDNPFVQSLGAPLDFKSFSEKAYKIPSGFDLSLPADKYQRKILIETLATDWFLPEPKHFLLQDDVRRVLTHGYMARPESKYLEIIQNTRDWLANYKNKRWAPVSIFKKPINTISLFGSPGMGKTHFWDNVMPSCFDQVVRQNNRIQVTFLVLNCSAFHSLKALCLNFFSELDNILIPFYQEHGVEYKNPYQLEFSKSTYTAEKLLPFLANVAAQNYLGVLIIDEVNHLTDGHKELGGMVNFFKNLTRAIGLPIIFSGTPDAINKLGINLQSIRRLIGLGMTTWGFYKKDGGDWSRFIIELWKFQVVDNPIPFSEEIKKTFYELTGGVMSLAVNLHIRSQTEALAFNRNVDVEFLKKVGHKYFAAAKKVTTAIKTKDPYLSSIYQDITEGVTALPEMKSSEREFVEMTNKLVNMKINPDQASKIIDLLRFQYPELSQVDQRNMKLSKGGKENSNGEEEKVAGSKAQPNEDGAKAASENKDNKSGDENDASSNPEFNGEKDATGEDKSTKPAKIKKPRTTGQLSTIESDDADEVKKTLDEKGMSGKLSDMI